MGQIRRILVIEDDKAYAEMIQLQLGTAGFTVQTANSGSEALEKLPRGSFDLILSDILMPGMSGLDLLVEIQRVGVKTPVVVMSAYGSVDTAIEAMKAGASDYVSKPFKKDELLLAIRKLEERETLKSRISTLEARLQQSEPVGDLIGSGDGMTAVYELIRKVSKYRSTVLITGESGTGKELVARAIHKLSPRAEAPFVWINCGAIPEQLLESELFGHVKGAFTDAHQDHKGLFEQAHAGSVLLDEIGELPQPLQVKLLRVLQDGEVRRVGGTKPMKIDVRVIAATAKDLKEAVADGSFRQDLFYRLDVVQISLPPLRQRIADLPDLMAHFIAKTNRKLGTNVEGIEAQARGALMAYSWPGNVRELENVIERAAVLAHEKIITTNDLPEHIVKGGPQEVGDPDDWSIKVALRRTEELFIRKALLKTGGNRTKAAQLLGLSHSALLYKMKEFNIDIPTTRP